MSQKKVRFENDHVYEAMSNVSARFGLNTSQMIERACKRELERLGVTWWKDLLEVNALKDKE